MNPVHHPYTKTAMELRRAISRLNAFKDINPSDASKASQLIRMIQDVRAQIPTEYRDADLNRGKS